MDVHERDGNLLFFSSPMIFFSSIVFSIVPFFLLSFFLLGLVLISYRAFQPPPPPHLEQWWLYHFLHDWNDPIIGFYVHILSWGILSQTR